MQPNSMRRIAIIITLLVPGAGQAFAADTSKQSTLLDIFQKGIEIPTYFILAGSVVAIALIIEHFLTVRRAGVAPAEQIEQARQQIETRNFRDCMEALRASQTFFARIMTAAMQHARHGFEAMHEAALEKSGELTGRMFRKAEYLNILGNLGPLLGLLGTVWGMIKAFGALGASAGQTGGDLAGGIAMALVNTLLGLALAIVGIGFYGVCRNRIDALTVGATVDALDLLEYFRPAPGGAKPAEPGRGRAAASGPNPQRPLKSSDESPVKG